MSLTAVLHFLQYSYEYGYWNSFKTSKCTSAEMFLGDYPWHLELRLIRTHTKVVAFELFVSEAAINIRKIFRKSNVVESF